VAEGLSHRVQVLPLRGQRLRLGEGGLHGGQHVGAGITVGHGEDIERIDLIDVPLEVASSSADGADEHGAVDIEAGHGSA